MKVETATREFTYNGVALKDPNPAHSVEQVREFYAAIYPEIVSAAIEGPENVGNKLVYAFRRAVGTKGSAEIAADLWTAPITAYLDNRADERVAFRDVLLACEPTTTGRAATREENHRVRTILVALGWHKRRSVASKRWGWVKAAPEPFVLPKQYRDKPVVIYGPAGSGKSLHIDAFARLFQRDTIVDPWDGSSALPPDAIAATNLSPRAILAVQASFLMPIKDATHYARRRGLF